MALDGFWPLVRENRMQTINWGIIGCGDVCERKSGPPLYQLAGSALVGVTCRRQELGQDFAKRHDCTYFDNVDSLVTDERIDAIYVATPSEVHLEHAQAALSAGKPVLVEKPMARNTAECDAMIASAATAQQALGVAYYRRCYPSILRIRDLLASGAIGEPRRMWINDQFPTSHRLDLCHFFFGPAEKARVFDGPLPPDSAVDHGAIVELRHAKNVTSAMGVAWRENHDIEQIIIDGSDGRLVLADLKMGRLKLIKEWTCQDEDQPPLPFTHWGLMENFNNHLRSGSALACDGSAGRQSTVIEDFIANTAADGNWHPVIY